MRRRFNLKFCHGGSPPGPPAARNLPATAIIHGGAFGVCAMHSPAVVPQRFLCEPLRIPGYFRALGPGVTVADCVP